MNRIVSTILFLASFSLLFAQQESPEVRRGNLQYNDSNYVDAEVNYRRALDKNDQSFEAHYNLGDALFRQEKFPEALEQYAKAEQLVKSNDKTRKEQIDKRLADTYHNMGNALYAQQQYDKAVAAYQQSLRRNPKDNDTRYNLVKACNNCNNSSKISNKTKTSNNSSNKTIPRNNSSRNSNNSKKNNNKISSLSKTNSRWTKKRPSRFCKHSNKTNKKHKRNFNANKARSVA